MGRPEYYGNPARLTADIDVVRAIYTAFAARDLDAAMPYVASGCEIHVEATARLAGRTEPYCGPEGLRQYFADVERVWDELTVHARDFRVIPGHVVVMGFVEGRAGGQTIRRAVVWTWRIRNGCAVHLRVADIGEANGSSPAP